MSDLPLGICDTIRILPTLLHAQDSCAGGCTNWRLVTPTDPTELDNLRKLHKAVLDCVIREAADHKVMEIPGNITRIPLSSGVVEALAALGKETS